MAEYRFIRPIDILFFRGNRLFGGPGDYSESGMPPMPSVIAGALRSKMLGADAEELASFVKNGTPKSDELFKSLGTKEKPGSFRLNFVTLARLKDERICDYFIPMPADVASFEDKTFIYLEPSEIADDIKAGYSLPKVPALRTDKQEKQISGYWLNSSGISTYLEHGQLTNDHVVSQKELWKTDYRLGIALDSSSRTAEVGRIYTSDAVALNEDIGFIVGVIGADRILPASGLLRLGGDGRGAEIKAVNFTMPPYPLKKIKESRRFKLTLATPGIFPNGWLPFGVKDFILKWNGLSARLVSASLQRAEIISGWDMLEQKPKRAMRVVPAGSVYWFEIDEEGDLERFLDRLVNEGFWFLDNENFEPFRLAEGFNNVFVGVW